MKKHILFVAALMVAATMFAKKGEVIITEGNVKFMQEAGKTAIVEVNFPNTQVVEFDDDKVKEDFGTIDQYLRAHNDDWTATIIQENTAGMEVDVAAMRKESMAAYDGQMFNFNNKKGMKILASQRMQNNSQAMDAKQKAKMQKYGILFGDRAAADYKFAINIDTLDMGNNAGVAATIMFGSFASEAGGVLLIGSMDVYDMHTNEIIAKIKFDKVRGDSGMTPDVRMMNVLNEIFVKELLPVSKKKK